MKQIVMIFSGVWILVLIFMILFTVGQRQLRFAKLENARTEVMKEYIEDAFKNESLRNQSDEEAQKYLKDAIEKRISEDAEYTLNILYRDAKEGILCLEIKEEYRRINGKTGQLTSSGIFILEEEKL